MERMRLRRSRHYRGDSHLVRRVPAITPSCPREREDHGVCPVRSRGLACREISERSTDVRPSSRMVNRGVCRELASNCIRRCYGVAPRAIVAVMARYDEINWGSVPGMEFHVPLARVPIVRCPKCGERRKNYNNDSDDVPCGKCSRSPALKLAMRIPLLPFIGVAKVLISINSLRYRIPRAFSKDSD
jgi:hypothetical protein